MLMLYALTLLNLFVSSNSFLVESLGRYTYVCIYVCVCVCIIRVCVMYMYVIMKSAETIVFLSYLDIFFFSFFALPKLLWLGL